MTGPARSPSCFGLAGLLAASLALAVAVARAAEAGARAPSSTGATASRPADGSPRSGRGARASSSSPSIAQAPVEARLAALFAREPSIAAVQAAVARHVGADAARVRSWRSRARKAAWLPELRVRVQKGWEDDLLVTANGPTRINDDSLRLELQARWRLDRLVFDRNELYVNREAVLLADLRRDAVAEATRLYFQRRRLLVERHLSARLPLRARLRLALRLDELTAELDALTGGFFRHALEPRR